jgi:hypothetical protein
VSAGSQNTGNILAFENPTGHPGKVLEFEMHFWKM